MTLSDLAFVDGDFVDGDFVVDGAGFPVFVTGVDVVRQDLLARLNCPPGQHWAYPALGVDLTKYVQGATEELTLLALRQDAEIGVEEDTRVLQADVVLTVLDLQTVLLEVSATLTDGALALLSTAIGGISG